MTDEHMEKEQVLSVIRASLAKLKALGGVQAVAVFGSTARDEASADRNV